MTAFRTGPLADDHRVLLWQTCAYAEELGEAARTSGLLAPAHDRFLGFLHYRLLPYLAHEEQELAGAGLRDEHLGRLLLHDHARIRSDVDTIEGCRTRQLLTFGTEALVQRLDRHLRREESWATDVVAEAHVADWALPLVLGEEVDLDALPAEHRDRLVLRRLCQMRAGESVLLRAGHDLHPLWRRQHRCDPQSHAWAYAQEGPRTWVAQVTRRRTEEDALW